MINIKKYVKRLKNGEIWICEEIKCRFKTEHDPYLFDLPQWTEEEIRKQIEENKLFSTKVFLSSLDIEEFVKKLHEYSSNRLFYLFEEQKEYLDACDRYKSQDRNCKQISTQKAWLTKRKNILETILLNSTWNKEYNEKIFPESLLNLYEIYKQNYDKLEEAYKIHKEKKQFWKEKKEKMREEIIEKYGDEFKWYV